MNRVGVGIFLCYFEKNGNFWNIPRISLIFLFFLKNVLYLCSVKKVSHFHCSKDYDGFFSIELNLSDL